MERNDEFLKEGNYALTVILLIQIEGTFSVQIEIGRDGRMEG